MRRLRLLDKVLLLTLVPLWGVCFASYVNDLVRGRLAWIPVTVAAPEDDHGYPTVRGATLPAWGEEGELEIGDQLLRLGHLELRGVGAIGFIARAYEAAGPDLRVPVSVLRAGERIETWMALRPLGLPWRLTLLTFPFVAVGVLLLLRMPGSRLARAVFLAFMAHSFHWIGSPGGSRAQTYGWLAVFTISALFAGPLVLRAILLFPEDRTRSARVPAWPWVFAVMGPIVSSCFFGVPLLPDIGLRVFFVASAAFVTVGLALCTRTFVHADPIGRRQLKWVMFGAWVAGGPILAANLGAAVGFPMWRLHEIATVAIALFPVCVFIAIARFNLFDIDRLLSTTAAYSVLTVVLLAALLILVPRLSQALSDAAAIEPTIVQPFLSLVFAGLLLPTQRYVRPHVERLFFAERHALENGVERLLRDLSVCDGPQGLLTFVGERLVTLLQPECCVLYGRTGDGYAPVFIRGRVVSPTIEAASALVRELEVRAAPIDVERWRRRNTRGDIGRADLALLDSLGAAVLLPISRSETLAAFVSLGEKRSGDIYSSTDLALLAAVADKSSSELLRFNEVEIRDQARAMQEALRRYVPEPVAARVVSGQELDMGEREVSVLFIDLRGYTTYSEGRTAAEIFATVNRYTETVSRVLRVHGGTVVEFNGDGMMAVFGAPEPITRKERAAVQAGCEAIAAVRALELRGNTPGDPVLDVGVGIATGKAFVGNIRSIDRWIWSAIGNTTNLAARLQSLTRELQAAMVIDAATWTAAGDVAADFERREKMPIRGRSQTEDVYMLPLTI